MNSQISLNPSDTEIYKALVEAEKLMADNSDILSVTVAKKYVDHNKTPYKSISFKVAKKDPSKNSIPRLLCGVLTDVVDDDTHKHFRDNSHVNLVNKLTNECSNLVGKYNCICAIMGDSKIILDTQTNKLVLLPALKIYVYNGTSDDLKNSILSETTCNITFEETEGYVQC